MADHDLRALERRYRESGAVDDHARWIAARARAGALSEHRVRLAAELGHEAAGRALGVAPAPLDALWRDVQEAAALSRQPGANAEAAWVLTGRAPDVLGSQDPPIDEESLGAAIEGAILRVVRDHLAASGAPPLDPRDAEGALRYSLSSAEVLDCFAPSERARVATLLDGAWAEEPARLRRRFARHADAAPWVGLFWPRHALDSAAARLVTELVTTPRGLELLARRSGPRYLAPLVAKVAGESAVRRAILDAVATDLLRE